MSFFVAQLLAVLAACEVARRSRFKGHGLHIVRYSAASLRVVASKHISERRKERVLPIYACRNLVASLRLAGSLIALITPFALVSLLFTDGAMRLLGLLSDPLWILSASAVAGCYFLGAPLFALSDAYSAGGKLLHRIALSSRRYRKLLFDLEREFYLERVDQPGRHVFVQGLARAGTTILTRAIHDSGRFASLTYADMPFVMSPNLWRIVTARFGREIEASERAHGDGIRISGESPESLDDVFWGTFCPDTYAHEDRIKPHSPSQATLVAYEQYAALVMRRYGRDRYLSKNNNNVLRLDVLARHFRDSRFLVPIRRPLEHGFSLRAQHRRFADADRFTRDYMSWLGHHEFGKTHRPFRVVEPPEWQGLDPESLNYWLAHWHDIYAYLLPIVRANENVLFVPYERLSGDPGFWEALCRELGIEPTHGAFVQPPLRRPDDPIDQDLLARAEDLYDRAGLESLAC